LVLASSIYAFFSQKRNKKKKKVKMKFIFGAKNKKRDLYVAAMFFWFNCYIYKGGIVVGE
jgi:hypothetical protein